MSEPEKQQEHQAVNIVEEPDTEEEVEEDFEEEEPGENPEESVEIQEPTGPQQTVVLVHKPAEPPTPIKLTPNNDQVDAWRTVLAVAQALYNDEATFKYNGNLTVRIMDPSRVSMIDAEIDMGLGINQLTETPAVKRKFTCNLAELSRALKMDKPTVEIGQDKAIFTTEGYRRKTRITVPVLEDSVEEISLPKLSFDIDTDLDLGEIFREMTKYLGSGNIPDHLYFSAENGKLTVKSTSEALQEFEMSGFKGSKDGKACFSTAFLKALAKKDWNISYSNDLPLKATLSITKTDYVGKENKPITTTVANLTVFLAPRVETE